LAKLGDCVGRENPGIQGMMDLAQSRALWQGVGDYSVGAGENSDIQFLFVRAIGTDGDHQCPWSKPLRAEDRSAAGGDRDNDLRAVYSGLDGV
jgi:hypothetical protein